MLRALVGVVAVVALLVASVSVVRANGKKEKEAEGKKGAKEHAMEAKKAAHEAKNHERKMSPATTATTSQASASSTSTSAAGNAKTSDAGQSKSQSSSSGSNMPVNLVPAAAEHRGPPAPIGQRELNQERRIEQGIRKGALTQQELADLNKQHDAILEKERQFRADGKLTPDERQQLQSMLNDSSRMIWADKHNTEGRQLPVQVCSGKDVFAKDSLIKKVSDPNLSATDAKAIFQDYRTMLDARRRLAGGNLSDSERAKLQTQYNELLNKYFEVRPPQTS